MTMQMCLCRRAWMLAHLAAAFTIMGALQCSAVASAPRLVFISRTLLDPLDCDITQVLAVPNVGLVVRCAPPHTVPIRVYSPGGKLMKTIGEGQLLEFAQDMTLDDRGRLWVPEVRQRRIYLFSLDGKFLDTIIVKKPSFSLHAVGVFPADNRYYLAGCLPTGAYVTDGCQFVHEYELSSNRYLESFISTAAGQYPNSLPSGKVLCMIQ